LPQNLVPPWITEDGFPRAIRQVLLKGFGPAVLAEHEITMRILMLVRAAKNIGVDLHTSIA
jgi:hypothetical protein